MYRLDYLPIAKQDMTEIVRYISHELDNPPAAYRLAQEMIEAAERLREFPYLNALHYSGKPLRHEYRKQIVKNYIMFYRVAEKEQRVTIARVIYARRNYNELL